MGTVASSRLPVSLLLLVPGLAQAAWPPLAGDALGEAPAVIEHAVDEFGTDLVVEIPGVEARAVDTPVGPRARLVLPDCGVDPVEGAPWIPTCRRFVEIPQGAEPWLEVVAVDWLELPLEDLGVDLPLDAVQPPIPKTPGAREAAGYLEDEAAFTREGWSWDAPARLEHIGQIRGRRFVTVEVAPVQVDAARGLARVASRVELRVDWDGADWDATDALRERYASPVFEPLFAEHLLPLPLPEGKQQTFDLPVGYLIIADDTMADAVAELADLRWRLGYDVTLVTTGELGAPNADTIQGYIQTAYDSWDVPPSFVLLVGDTRQIPAFRGQRSRSATDLYYSTMEGMGDWLPDLYIGRLSVDNVNEATVLADKTVAYTTFDLGSGSDWIMRATFMASRDNSYITEGTHDYCIETWLNDAGMQSTTRYTVSDQATTGQVLADFEAGLSQLTYSGHGTVNGWEDGPQVTANQVRSLGNVEMWPLVQSYACDTGNYEADCFAETWTTADNGGVAFYGSSTSSLWDEDDILQRRVYDAWYGDGWTWLAGMFGQGMWALNEHYGGRGETQSYYEQFNLFGDPALDPWTAIPQELDVTALLVDGLLDVDVLDASGAKLGDALVSVTTSAGAQWVAYTNANGRASFDLSTAEAELFDLAVSAHNAIPHFTEVEEWVPIDTGDTADGGGDGDGDGIGPGGCGCAGAAGGAAGWFVLLGLPLVGWRRRGR